MSHCLVLQILCSCVAVQLRTFVRGKEVEIEELCKQHYEEFIRAVDELRSVSSPSKLPSVPFSTPFKDQCFRLVSLLSPSLSLLCEVSPLYLPLSPDLPFSLLFFLPLTAHQARSC